MPGPRHFLSLLDLGADELRRIVARAGEWRRLRAGGGEARPLAGKTLAMLFEKSSTRTRVSFETGMTQLGGHAMFLSARDLQLGRGEPIEDTARVISRMVDAVMIRTFSQATLETFAAHSAVPVINGLSDRYHPCQLLADLQTWDAHHGDPAGLAAAWIGDGNNVCHSFINAARLLGFTLRIACPEGFDPDPALVAAAGAQVSLTRDPRAAADGANLVVTDVWASMGQEDEQAVRKRAFSAYQVDAALMALADRDAIFMHCLPAHRGEEVTAEVVDGAQSVVWEEAENRLHAQKALLEFLLGTR